MYLQKFWVKFTSSRPLLFRFVFNMQFFSTHIFLYSFTERLTVCVFAEISNFVVKVAFSKKKHHFFSEWRLFHRFKYFWVKKILPKVKKHFTIGVKINPNAYLYFQTLYTQSKLNFVVVYFVQLLFTIFLHVYQLRCYLR